MPPARSAVAEARVFGLVLGQVIAQLRAQRGMSQMNLATAAGISQPQVSRIEAGTRPDAFTYGRVAAALGVTVQTLDQHVHKAMERTRAAAVAATHRRNQNVNWAELLAIVGIVGLVTFAVAVVLAQGKGGSGGGGGA